MREAGYYLGFIGKWGVGQPPEGLFDYNKGWPGQNQYYQKVRGEDPFEYLTPGAGQDGQPAFHQFPYDAHLHSMYRDVLIPPAPLSEPAFFEALPELLKTSENRVRWQVRFATPEMYQESVKAYYRLISGVDIVVGRIVQKLDELGLDDNTIILYTGDNGFYLGERGLAGKWFPHEPSIRVPLVVYDPRLPADQRGTRRAQMVLSIDLAPTMLAMAGVQIPERVQGESLGPLIAGEHPAWRTEFFYEHLFQHPRIPRTEAVRDTRYKFIRYLDAEPPYEELYDLENDPPEAHNLADDPSPAHAVVLERMRQKWQAWRERAK